MTNEINIITTLEQQKEVYQGIKDDAEAVERWEFLMKIIAGLDASTISFIKGENK